MKKTLAWMAAFGCMAALMTGCGSKEDELKALQTKLDTLQSYIEVNLKADIENWDGEYVGYGEFQMHPIFDDTAILEAHQTGDTSALSEQDAKTLKMALDVIRELDITDEMSDYEKEKAIYDWQVAYVRYDQANLAAIPPDINLEDYNYHPYGVLTYHQAICVGNATTFDLMMGLLGIESYVIHSTEQGEHAWNLVKIEDGWYHVDVTFDNSSTGEPDYTFFNVPDAVKQNGGYPWDAAAFPKADATKYCYAVQNCTELADLYAFPAHFNETYRERRAEPFNLFVSFADGSAIDYELLSQLTGWLGGGYLSLNTEYSLDDGSLVQALRYDPPYEEEPSEQQPAYDYEQMEQVIMDVFSEYAVG